MSYMLRVAIKKIMWIFEHVRFVCEIVLIDGSVTYEICIDEPNRLTAFNWKHPEDIQWSVN